MRMPAGPVPFVIVFVIAFGGPLYAAPVVIDDFETNGTGFGPGGLLLEADTVGTSASISEQDVNTIGKERITTVTLLEGTRAFAEINGGSSGVALLGVDGDSRGRWQFEYGVSDPWWDDLVGTGGNFNLGASFLDADPGGTLTVEVRDRLLGNEATASTAIAQGPGLALIRFDQFPGVDFSDVTYIRFQIDAPAGSGYTIDAFMSTNVIPTPTAAQGGLALLVLVVLATRRRARHRRLDRHRS